PPAGFRALRRQSALDPPLPFGRRPMRAPAITLPLPVSGDDGSYAPCATPRPPSRDGIASAIVDVRVGLSINAKAATGVAKEPCRSRPQVGWNCLVAADNRRLEPAAAERFGKFAGMMPGESGAIEQPWFAVARAVEDVVVGAMIGD